MAKIQTLIVEKNTEGWYGVYCNEIPGVTGFAETEEEAIEDFRNAVQEALSDYLDEDGNYPEWYDEDMEFKLLYDLATFFDSFRFINISEFAKEVGVNESLMRKYKTGAAYASSKQKAKIQKGYNHLLERLSRVQF